MKILFLSLLSFYFCNCAQLQTMMGGDNKPTFSLKSIDITKITLENISLKLLTDIKNPYPLAIPRSLVDMDIGIEGFTLTKFKTDLGKIESNSSKTQGIDLVMKYSDLLEIYKKVPSKELLDVKLNGTLGLPIPESLQFAGKQKFDFPINETKQIPAILPSIDIKNFKIIKPEPKINVSGVQATAYSYLERLLSGKKVPLGSAASEGLSIVDIDVATEFDISLINQAASKLNFSNLKYDLNLNGEKFVAGIPSEIITNGKESLIRVKSSFPLKSLSSGIVSAIQTKSSAFQLNGVSGIKVDGLPDGLMNFEYDKKGNFKW